MERIVQIEENVSIIPEIIRKPNSLSVLLFVQNISKLLTRLPPVDFLQYFGLFFGMVSEYKQMCFLADSPQEVDNIHGAICFAYFCISSLQF